MTFTLARGGARSDRHTTRHADQVEPPQTVMVGPTQAVRTTGASTTRDDRAVAPDHRLRAPRTGWLAKQESRIGDPVVPDRRTVQCWGRYADAIARWEHITGRPAPAPALLNDADGPRPAPEFVEWLMGLPAGWVTGTDELTQNQQITALGNGVQPLQAALALSALLD